MEEGRPLAEKTQASKAQLNELFARAQAGDQDAWEELVRHCWPKILRVVRRRLNSPMRSLYDSTDFANDVLGSLVAKSDRFDFPTFEALTAYLAQSAEKKVIDEHRRQHRQKRDIRKGVYLGGAVDDAGNQFEPPAHDPTASQVAQADEAKARIFQGMPERERRVLDLKEQHYTNEEVAGITGLDIRTIQRILKRIYDSLRIRGGSR
jgi:RNA polymerase sigma-70 factor (ECF subfamily)